jgi:hypothetical protein
MVHSKRDKEEQKIHDRVIRELAQKLREEGYRVRTNPGTSKKHAVNRNGTKFWPDVYTYEDSVVTRIYEVETPQTTNSGAVDQWIKYSRGKSSFYLVIPEESVEVAKNLMREYNIEVDGYLSF